jgi:histidinol-phosphate aminotransferase
MTPPSPHAHLRAIWRTSERHEGRRGFVCLDRNERVSPIPETIFRDMLAHLTVEDIMTYPDTGPFVERLARQLSLPEDHIAETAGSDAALRRLFMAYLRPGGGVVSLDPSYAMYDIYTQIFRGESKRISYPMSRRCDVASVLGAIEPGVQLVIIAHPDQPVGTAIAAPDIRRIVARAAEVGAICLVDEAYYPFNPTTVIGAVREFDTLLVTRSFSKYPGCAGLRLGYAVGHPDLIKGLMAVRGGNEVSGLSLAVGCYLLDHPVIAEDFRSAAEEGRRRLIARSTELGFEPLQCVTNFHLLRCPSGLSPKQVAEALERRGYLVKHGFAHPCIKDCIRVSLNGPDIMDPFLEVLTLVASELTRHRLAGNVIHNA